jgi:hypothetical protein
MYLVNYYQRRKIFLLQLQKEEDEIIIKDMDEDLNKVADHVAKGERASKKDIIEFAKLLEAKGFPVDKISTKIRYEEDKRGCIPGFLHYITEVLSDADSRWIDKNFSRGGGNQPSENLENLNKKISDKHFDDLHTSQNDTMPTIAKRKLTDAQFNRLSPAEQQQYYDIRDKYFSQQKAVVNHSSTNDQTEKQSRGIMSQEQSNKKSTIIPPKQLWGESDTYRYIHEMAEKYDTISKYLRDVAKQVYVFKLDTSLDKEALKLFKQYHDERMVPLWETSLIGAEEIISILENVQDEKNRDTALGWMIKGCDKHWNYGNHGTGEVDFIQTGEYVYKLGKDEKTIIKIAVKRETTREQIGDKTTVRILDKGNQIFIHCPNYIDYIKCKECGSETFVHKDNPKKIWDHNCGLDFNKPIIGDEERDLFAGDLFYKAADFLRVNKLSQAIETICDGVIYVNHQTPEEFFVAEWKRRGKDVKVPKNLKVIEEKKPEKIKTVDLKPENRAGVGYNILWGRAHRTADKADWFSRQS